MPREQRGVPLGMGRFNYWVFSVAFPRAAGLFPEQRPPIKRGPYQPGPSGGWGPGPPVDVAAHDACARNFRAILNGSRHVTDEDRAGLAALLQLEIPDSSTFALAQYIANDKLWEQDQEAQSLLKTLPNKTQENLKAFNRKRWRYQGPWRWDVLLPTIARDQEVFLKFLEDGPAKCGLTSARHGDPVWEIQPYKAWGYKPGTVKTLYREYRRQASVVSGEGFPLTKEWQAAIQSDPDLQGLVDERGRLWTPRQLPTQILSSLGTYWPVRRAPLPRDDAEEVLHWFTHSLRNLCRYRDGHAPITYSDDCAETCRKVQKQLSRSR